MPPAIPWAEAFRALRREWHVGQHFALVGRTRSGKTTFAREILALRDWVVVFGTKPRDVELYAGFERAGYVVKDKWSPYDTDERRVIFRPPGTLTDTGPQRAAFTRALEQIYETGAWTIYVDEILVLSRDLGMDRILNRMWTQAASNDVTMVAGTQRPRGAPLNMFEQMSLGAFWKMPDAEDRYRAAEMLGTQRGMAMEAMSILPRYEALVVDTINDTALRTKVRL